MSANQDTLLWGEACLRTWFPVALIGTLCVAALLSASTGCSRSTQTGDLDTDGDSESGTESDADTDTDGDTDADGDANGYMDTPGPLWVHTDPGAPFLISPKAESDPRLLVSPLLQVPEIFFPGHRRDGVPPARPAAKFLHTVTGPF